MPDSQLNARWLSKEDRLLAIERVRVNQQGIGNKHFKMYQLKEALLDPLTWAFAFYALAADIPNGGISNFFSQLIVSFGYTPEQSLLYGTPGGAIEVVALILCGYYGDRWGQRILISTLGLIVAILGMLLIVALPLSNNIGRLIGYYLTQASPTPFVALLSLIASNVAGYTKKTTVAAIYLIAYCTGNIIGTFAQILHHVASTKYLLHRPTNFPPQRRPALHSRRNHHHLLLGRLSHRHGFHLVVLSAPEQEEGRVPCAAALYEAGESGMVGFDGSGESGICVYFVDSRHSGQDHRRVSNVYSVGSLCWYEVLFSS